MKRLVCEMCSSNDLVKIDGLFVCQYCGTKYSVEEAKKMMFDGPVEVQGTVRISNVAQTSSLLNMAKSAFDSKNYVKAEAFCDQALSIDDSNSEAWRLKGRSIHKQTSSNNSRLLEAYNCALTAFSLLDDAEKAKPKGEFYIELKGYIDGNVDSISKKIAQQIPSKNAVSVIESSFLESRNMLHNTIQKLEIKDIENKNMEEFDNAFIGNAENATLLCWQNLVSRRYYQDNYDSSTGKWINDDYRPTTAAYYTFIDEIDRLIDLMHFCVGLVNKSTPLGVHKRVYQNDILLNAEAIKACAFEKIMIPTMMRSSINSKPWRWKYVLNMPKGEQTKRFAIIEEDKKTIESLNKKAAEREEEEKRRQARLEIETTKQRIKSYWEEHTEEKLRLENERTDLANRIKDIQKAIETQPGISEQRIIHERIYDLSAARNALPTANKQERKAIQAQIDSYFSILSVVNEKVNRVSAELQKEISPLQERIKQIYDELNRER